MSIETITARELRALLAFACEDKARASLYGITVRGDGALAASDGHSLVVRGHAPTDSWRGGRVVPRPAVEDLLAGRKPKDLIDILHLLGRSGETHPSSFDYVIAPPRSKPTGSIGLAPHLLARLDVIDRAIGPRTFRGWEIKFGGELEQIQARPLCGDPWLVVIMPMRM